MNIVANIPTSNPLNNIMPVDAAKKLRCHAIAIIVLCCFNPWFSGVFWFFVPTLGILFVGVGMGLHGVLIAAAVISLRMVKGGAKMGVKRAIVFAFCVAGACFDVATIATYFFVLIGSIQQLKYDNEMNINVAAPIVIGCCLAFDGCIKIPLIVNSLLLGVETFKIFKNYN